MPVQHSCEEINGMRSLEGDIEYISWIVNLVLHGMVWHEIEGDIEAGR